MDNQNNEEFICVFQPMKHMQAGMIREALQDAGINCFVNNEAVSSMRFGGFGIGAGKMNVMVPRDQAEQAKKIIFRKKACDQMSYL